jgi:hypothetical protein
VLDADALLPISRAPVLVGHRDHNDFISLESIEYGIRKPSQNSAANTWPNFRAGHRGVRNPSAQSLDLKCEIAPKTGGLRVIETGCSFKFSTRL